MRALDAMYERAVNAETIGDRMQSEGARMAEHILKLDDAPYEVTMAAVQFESDAVKWTEHRIGTRS